MFRIAHVHGDLAVRWMEAFSVDPASAGNIVVIQPVVRQITGVVETYEAFTRAYKIFYPDLFVFGPGKKSVVETKAVIPHRIEDQRIVAFHFGRLCKDGSVFRNANIITSRLQKIFNNGRGYRIGVGHSSGHYK